MDKIIPIGKHKGKSIEEIRLIEPQYLDWLAAQDWFNKKYSDLIEAIRGGGQPADTPEHNALQARFLDPQFTTAAVVAAWPSVLVPVANDVKIQFEEVTDVLLKLPGYYTKVGFEVKPSVGDDYPAIIRQIKIARGPTQDKFGNLVSPKAVIALLYDKYTGSGVDEATMRKIVEASSIPTVTLAETLAAKEKMYA